jgi:Ca2+:H+ antiporter
MGLCYVLAGLRYRRPQFKRDEAGHHSVLMMLTMAALIFPSIGALALCGNTTCQHSRQSSTIVNLSVGISVVLLLAYCAYVAYGIFGLESLSRGEPEGREVRHLKEVVEKEGRAAWPVWFGVAVLAGATVCLVPVTDILTGSVSGVTAKLGWTEVFVGIIVVANAGNVAEGYAALKMAWKRPGRPQDSARGDSGLDLSLGIASASSIQIATFVAPLVVLYSLSQHTMTLAFSPIEDAVLALLVLIFAYTAQDGETNWLEGAQLLALYAMAATVFFTLPVSVFGE